jgi:hypothetical protein
MRDTIMLQQWYVQITGAERGPVTRNELRSLAASGQLAAGDLVRTSSEQAWSRADSVPELFEANQAAELPSCSEDRLTGEMPTDENAWCSLELQSTDTKSSIRWTTPGSATVVTPKPTSGQHAIVRVPHRTLKVGHAATPTGRAERRAHQTTVANRVDVDSDTVVSSEVSGTPDSTSQDSTEHRL